MAIHLNILIYTHFYVLMNLTKKDIVSFNQQAGEQGLLRSESSLDFALSVSKTKKNWLYELSYVVRCLLIDHPFTDGNKRTTFLVVVYTIEEGGKNVDKDQLLVVIHQIASKNITHPVSIMRLLYHVIREKN